MMSQFPLHKDSFLWENYWDTRKDDGSCNGDDKSEEEDDDVSFDESDLPMTWASCPDIFLERVFSYLSLRDRYHASLVCRHWYDVFFSPILWRKLIMSPVTFTHQRYTPHKGYWTELSHHKVQMCLKKVGAFVRSLYIEPIAEFYNLYEFIRILNMFIEFHATIKYPMESLVNFYFTFCCENRQQSDVIIYGTGGTLLKELKRLLSNLRRLESIKLNHLLLDLDEAPGVLDCVVSNCSQSLQYIEIRNFTKELYPLFIAGMFSQLKTVVISPQHLNSFIVQRLAAVIDNLHIVQDHYCDESYVIDHDTWKAVTEKNPDLNVHLSVDGQSALELNWQEGAPVSSVTYTTKYSKVYPLAIDIICIQYNTTLKVYGHYGLPRYHGSRSFNSRCDSYLVNMVRVCHKLHTLIIRERISTATLIILAREGKQLRRLHVRHSGLIKRCDWQRTLMWDEDYYWSMRRAAHSYDSTYDEVSKCLGYRWRPMTDKEFMDLKPPHGEAAAKNDFDTS